MNCDPSSSLDMCYGELLREEQCLVTWATFQQDKLPINVVVPMLLKWKEKVKTCKKFNVSVARNIDNCYPLCENVW